MRITKLVSFIFQFVTVGLAAAFVILYFYPNLLSPGLTEKPTTAVEFKESTTPPATAGKHAAAPNSYADAVERAAPAVVNISTKKIITERVNPFFDDPVFRQFFGNNFGGLRKRQETSLGSGVIISSQGYILTNHHVANDADEIEVALANGLTTTAKVVGADPESDLAVLKIQLKKLPVITLGKSEQLRVGDVVLAIGNPFGVGQTVTAGIVSATGRNMLGINTFENFIQTDAAINPGNSGGALINASGELIGINTVIFSRSGGSQGIGFAIPISLARDVMEQIIQHGKVIRGWLGVAIQDISKNLAESFGLKNRQGAIISNVVINGPADKAGLTRGDVITHINDTVVINVRHTLDIISRFKPGTTIRIKGIRKGKAFEKKANVVERPPQEK